jgi:DNA-binding winged helix-turn-helix (wHTH) protein
LHKTDPHPVIEDRFLDHPYALAGRVIDPVPGTLTWQGKTTHLRRKELEILALLASVGGQVVSRQAFIGVVWDGNNMVGDHAITNTMSSLRQALEDDDSDHPLIRTIPRRGYQLAVPVQPTAVSERAFLPGSNVPGSPGWRLVRRLSQPGVAESSASESWLAEPSAYSVDADSTKSRVFRFVAPKRICGACSGK